MKLLLKLILVLSVGIGSAATAIGAPVFDIDFYGGDTTLVQGVHDTQTNINLSQGETVLVDILASGFDEPGNGLLSWALCLDYGDSLSAANLQRDTTLWPSAIRQPNIQDGRLTIEGMSFIGNEGNDLLLERAEKRAPRLKALGDVSELQDWLTSVVHNEIFLNSVYSY